MSEKTPETLKRNDIPRIEGYPNLYEQNGLVYDADNQTPLPKREDGLFVVQRDTKFLALINKQWQAVKATRKPDGELHFLTWQVPGGMDDSVVSLNEEETALGWMNAKGQIAGLRALRDSWVTPDEMKAMIQHSHETIAALQALETVRSLLKSEPENTAKITGLLEGIRLPASALVRNQAESMILLSSESLIRLKLIEVALPPTKKPRQEVQKETSARLKVLLERLQETQSPASEK